MSDQWWPGGTEDPAFTVQRQPYGEIEGGDYVRARIATVANQAALPPAASVPLGEQRITLDNNHLWRVEAGPTWVDRGIAPPQVPQTAVRYLSQAKGWEDVRGKALLAVRPYTYEIMEIIWDWPENLKEIWLEVALVRSSFGRPTTPNDGVTVFRMTKEAMAEKYGADFAPPVFDGGEGPPTAGGHVYKPHDKYVLLGGRWYYYTLFFKTTPVDWVAAYQMGSPLPKNYGHAEHLWNHVPPWYQYTDDNIRVDDGFLRNFLRIFGFELDLTREYIEQWQKLYHIDFSPIRLLRHLGDNFNVAYESGLGDIRYRGLVGNVATLYAERGTRKGLQRLVESASQYRCDITRGDNLMLIPEDSEFVGGTGNWAATAPTQKVPVAWGAVNPYTKTVFRTVDTATHPPPPSAGRGVMEITPVTTMPDPPWGPPLGGPGSALPEFVSYCGVGIKYVSGPVNEDGTYEPTTKELTPLYGGVAVQPGVLYGCSVWLKEPVPAVTRLGLLWYGSGGTYADLLSNVESGPVTPTANVWTEFTVQQSAPEPPTPGAYVVPYIRISPTAYDRSIYVAGVMVYAQGAAGTVTAFAPDQYLTLGDPGEVMGVARETAPKGGYLLGEPS